MNIALVQINPVVGDFQGNRNKIISKIKEVRENLADVVVFPELAITGYPPEDLLLRRHFIEDAEAEILKIKRHTDGITVIIGGISAGSKGGVYNSAFIFCDKVLAGVYNKIVLPNYGVFDEKRYFEGGDELYILDAGELKIGVSICEDIWGDALPCKMQAKEGADVIVNISASPFHAGKYRERLAMVKSFSEKNNVSVVYVNMVGGQDELVFDGGSFCFAKGGKFCGMAPFFEEGILFVELDKDGTSSCGRRKIKKLSEEEEIFNALVLGVRDYARKNGFNGVVLGLSGGIDSALVAVIAKEALGAEGVLTISMPSFYTSSGTKSDAERLANNLKTDFFEIPINDIFTAYIDTLKPYFKGTESGVAEENIQARIRGNILMAFSNKFGYLLLTTGNKSEMAVGYCTLYGDMAGGFAVLKDVSKTTVYKLANYYNKLKGRDVIPKSIIRRPPTAELRPNQKDSDSLPPYRILDKIITNYVECDKSIDYTASSVNNIEVVEKIVKMIDRNEYKRRQSPPGIKITPKAFGRDRRMPITNRYVNYVTGGKGRFDE